MLDFLIKAGVVIGGVLTIIGISVLAIVVAAVIMDLIDQWRNEKRNS